MRIISPNQPLRVLANAKLNLGLEVTGRRADGYHELVTIFQSVSLADEITVNPAVAFSYEPIPGVEPESDLVIKALQLVGSRWQVELEAAVIVEKHIPMAAGLGGGSADAAVMLRAIAKLAGIRLTDVTDAGGELGSDVPFLIQGGTALGTGTGTTLEPLPTPVDLWFAVVIPELEILNKTTTLYRSLRPKDFTDGTATRTQAGRLRRGEPLDARLIANPFENTLMQYPVFKDARNALEAVSNLPAHVSGAGPALFTVCRSKAEAEAIDAVLTERGYHSLSCRAIAAG